ncbi:WXG100 family type VII secretion target [Austwickia chelonae]|uniref:WXG100 family type VII secretion target n=1 Tax=Austwickia chelonae TaxID=100225 RepID=UPI000E230522|nr:WXG100 family type VII secretion target [Austwickia chelonae]
MSEIGVNFGGLAGTHQRVTATVNQMNAQLSDLKSMLAPMVSTWTGEAATNYNEKQRQWDQAAADLNAVLAAIGNAVAQANEGYQSTERANIGRF